MAFYSKNKRLRGDRAVYSTSVKQKNKGKIVSLRTDVTLTKK